MATEATHDALFFDIRKTHEMRMRRASVWCLLAAEWTGLTASAVTGSQAALSYVNETKTTGMSYLNAATLVCMSEIAEASANRITNGVYMEGGTVTVVDG